MFPDSKGMWSCYQLMPPASCLPFEVKHPSSLFLVIIANAFPPNGTVQCRTEEQKQVCLTWPPQATTTLLHKVLLYPLHTLKPFKTWCFLVKSAKELWLFLRQDGGIL